MHKLSIYVYILHWKEKNVAVTVIRSFQNIFNISIIPLVKNIMVFADVIWRKKYDDFKNNFPGSLAQILFEN